MAIRFVLKSKAGEKITISYALTEKEQELIKKEKEYYEELQKLKHDRNSYEYASIHKKWFLLRIRGEEKGLFFSIIPTKYDVPTVTKQFIEKFKK
jgi:hypothetical protein